jgi:hypothetical protein
MLRAVYGTGPTKLRGGAQSSQLARGQRTTSAGSAPLSFVTVRDLGCVSFSHEKNRAAVAHPDSLQRSKSMRGALRTGSIAISPQLQGGEMKRRDFITLLGCSPVWPLAARAQSERLRRIGIVMGVAANDPGARSECQRRLRSRQNPTVRTSTFISGRRAVEPLRSRAPVLSM